MKSVWMDPWDMAGKAHQHGLFQQFLGSLASAGILLAVASKNDRALVEQALLRSDILFPKRTCFRWRHIGNQNPSR